MSIKCLIIDDEPLAINVIKNYLIEINDIEIVNTYNNGVDAINYLKDNHLLFQNYWVLEFYLNNFFL